MKIAITGAGGQLGSILADSLGQATGAAIVAVCRNELGAGGVNPATCEIRIGSVTERDAARKLLGDCDLVVNCALAGGLPRAARAENEAMIEAFAAVAGVKTVVYLSSVAVYGGCIKPGLTSFEHPRPDSAYGFLKRDGERHAQARLSGCGKDLYILRLGHVYGPGMAMSRNILSWTTEETFGLPFGGDRLSNAIRANRFRDAIAAIALRRCAPATYNLADDPHRTWREIFDWHARVVGVNPARGLSEAISQRFQERLTGRNAESLIGLGAIVVGEAAKWGRTVPSHFLAGCPSVREFARHALALLPEWAEQRSKGLYNRDLLGSVSRDLFEGRWMTPEPWIMSVGMPGPYVSIPEVIDPSREATIENELRAWYRLWASPDGFLDLLPMKNVGA